MTPDKPLLTRRYGMDKSWTLPVAEGAYSVARDAMQHKTPEALRESVKAANLRGRGGAGFAAGIKWGFVNAKPGQQIYLVINADEGEPGTFKDRSLMERDPHRVLEGIMLSAYALGAHTAYIYVRCELALAIARLEQAIDEAKAKGYLGARPF
ncbi:MAG: NADH-quinone oxidoreductase subunit NuoF, partial [Polyangiales bacterium]